VTLASSQLVRVQICGPLAVECDGRRLACELDALLGDPARLAAMREAARGHAYPDAAARVAALVDAHAR